MTIQKILIANRGEIAVRIARTCREMGITSVAVYSDADRDAMHVLLADEAIYIGGSEVAQSYLDIEKLITAAKESDADAIHPGYGFLSENANFAARCLEEKIVFIGPNVYAIRSMGSKSRAKEIMQANGVPIVPGYQGKDQSVSRLIQEAEKIGFPLLLKAAAGGGGKGMRIVRSLDGIENDMVSARREAMSAFGDDELIIEKYIDSGRHIEFQILADQHNNILHLLERECTIQRRYQKIIEESPSPALSDALRMKMSQAAIAAAAAIGYDNAGTVEFIFDSTTQEYYFLEVNTRLQVEHPVTEAITGLDIVRLQIWIAEGKELPITQQDIQANGYAIECRVYAEDPDHHFHPANGQILHWDVPEMTGVRVDTGVSEGAKVSIFYDPMLAKVIVHDMDRASAIRKMNRVIRQTTCLGVVTNLGFLAQILTNNNFVLGRYDTHFIANESWSKLAEQTELLVPYLIAACVAGRDIRRSKKGLLSNLPTAWRNNPFSLSNIVLIHDETEHQVSYTIEQDHFICQVGAQKYFCRLVHKQESVYTIDINGKTHHFTVAQDKETSFIHHNSLGAITLRTKERLPLSRKTKDIGGYEASMPSQIIKIFVSVGQSIHQGDPLLVTSSMKMENTILAIQSGTVTDIFVEEGLHVEKGTLLLKMS